MVITHASNFANLTEFLSHYLPRITIVLFIEVFSYFFLNLYRATQIEIRKYQDDLTALAIKQVAVEGVWFSPDPAARAALSKQLLGSVWEWCDDFYYPDQTAGGSPRVLRGGSFVFQARDLRASFRDRNVPENRGRGVGFRCVLAAPRQPLRSTS